MADSILLNDFVENLLQMISQHMNLTADTKEQLEHLLEEVKVLSAFLEDAAAATTQKDSRQWEQFVKKVRVTVYKADDTIDKFLLQAKLHIDKNMLRRLFDYSYFKAIGQLKDQIGTIRSSLKELREQNQLSFQMMPGLLDQSETSIKEIQDALLDVDEVVGFDLKATDVIERLRVEGALEVVPIVGMAGLGKTTLARKIYADPRITYEFFITIWVHVGQKYERKEILLNILKVFTRRTDEYQDKDVDELSKMILEFISRGGKCLIVLDDVWTADVVDAVMNVFPRNNKGHRIIITTREGRVAKYANENPYYLDSLQEEKGFELLSRRVFRSKSFPEELEDVGRRIVEKCNGLPLAIVVIAGVLRGHTSEREWRRVEKEVEKHLMNKDDPRSCFKFVEMSYTSLPEYMKACFLYCATFPQSYDIPAWKLVRLWISEGFISNEEKAEDILNELVAKNLLIVTQKKADGEIKTCRLDNTLHNFCKIEAANQCLFHEVSASPGQANLTVPGPGDCRRLCIQHSLLNDFISQRPSIEHVRSFLCFSSRKHIVLRPDVNIRQLHKAFPLIRVLDIEPLEFSFSRDFMKLFHLRYITLSGAFTSLPRSFGKFWNLQTVIVTSTCEGILDIKANIWNMLQLRHLHTNIPARLSSPSIETEDKPSCLQTLSKVDPESCRKDVLARACNVRKLSIQGRLEGFVETQFSNFVELKCLESLKLNSSVNIKPLHLPPAFFGYLRKLRNLTLSNTRFDWSEASRLAQLECLEVLKLKHNAFTGMSWEMEVGGFSLLKVLWIENADLKTWKVSNLQFQSLRLLVLKSCNDLEAVPIGLVSVDSLQEIRLENTNKAIESAQAIQQSKKGIESFKFKLSIFPPTKN